MSLSSQSEQHSKHQSIPKSATRLSIGKTVQQPGEINSPAADCRLTAFHWDNTLALRSTSHLRHLPQLVRSPACQKPTLAQVKLSSSQPITVDSMSNSNPNGSGGSKPPGHQNALDAVQAKGNLFGMYCFRVADRDKAPLCAVELNKLLECIAGVDPGAIIMPHDCDKSKAQYIQNHKIADFQKFADIQSIPWGAPGEKKGKAAFSF